MKNVQFFQKRKQARIWYVQNELLDQPNVRIYQLARHVLSFIFLVLDKQQNWKSSSMKKPQLKRLQLLPLV